MLITNPFDIVVTAAGSVADVTWELDDGTGQRLSPGDADDDPNWKGGSNPASSDVFHMRGFVFVLPKSATGALRLSPFRQNKQGIASKLPELAIPVRFGSATSTLTVMVPKDYGQYDAEANDWVFTHPTALFSPKSAFIKETLTIMHVNDKDVVFASAEAAAEKASVLSKAPVRIVNFAVQAGTAYVDLNLNYDGYGWAGISFTIAKVEPLIEKDLSQFPNIRKVVFSWPPPPGASGSPASPHAPGAQSRRGVAAGITAWIACRFQNRNPVPGGLDIGESGR